MAKAVWQGYIALGQLGIPVRLYSATRAVRPRFVQLHEKDSAPVERALRCSRESKDISIREVIRAVEYEPGRYITLTDQELERGTPNLKTIDIKQFAQPETIESIYYQKPFYIVPTRGGERAYALLREVLARSGKIAIAQFVIYTKEHIAALCVRGDLLMLYQLRFDAEILPRAEVDAPPLPKPSPTEIEALSAVVERFSGPFYIQDYYDENSEMIAKLIERKAKGLPAPRRERLAPHATPENQIVSALENTLGNPQAITESRDTENRGAREND